MRYKFYLFSGAGDLRPTSLQVACSALLDTASQRHLNKELARALQIKDVTVSKPVF
jgi:hypothetical protein